MGLCQEGCGCEDAFKADSGAFLIWNCSPWVAAIWGCACPHSVGSQRRLEALEALSVTPSSSSSALPPDPMMSDPLPVPRSCLRLCVLCVFSSLLSISSPKAEARGLDAACLAILCQKLLARDGDRNKVALLFNMLVSSLQSSGESGGQMSSSQSRAR